MARHCWGQSCLCEAEEIAVPNVSLELYPGPEVIELILQRLDSGEQDARQRCAVCTGFHPDASSLPSGPPLQVTSFVVPQDLPQPAGIRV